MLSGGIELAAELSGPQLLGWAERGLGHAVRLAASDTCRETGARNKVAFTWRPVARRGGRPASRDGVYRADTWTRLTPGTLALRTNLTRKVQ